MKPLQWRLLLMAVSVALWTFTFTVNPVVHSAPVRHQQLILVRHQRPGV